MKDSPLLKKSEKFEQQIHRIHHLLEQPGSEVTWNDHLPDPDNPSQSRQIDVTIRRESKLTLIECRIHAEKQDVKWIEELIGRRTSLRADAVIAVSASGFTEGAIIKAKAFGIILRDLLTLTKEEISHWGHMTRVRLLFYEFKDVSLIFRFNPEHLKRVTVDQVEQYLRSSPNALYAILEQVTSGIVEKDRLGLGQPGQIEAHFGTTEVTIGEQPVAAIDVIAKFSLRRQKLRIPSVVAYDAPDIKTSMRETFIEKVDLGEFEITQSSNNVFVTLDLSAIEIPPIVCSVLRILNLREWLLYIAFSSSEFQQKFRHGWIS